MAHRLVPPPTPRPDRGASVPRLSPWGFIVSFGAVAMLADVVYEGARSITGPLLAELGATALVVGLVTGVGESAALLLRLVSGPLADRTRRFWAWVIAGYAVTVISVPLLGLTTSLGIAAALIIAERIGKAIRSPAKDTLLSHASTNTGRGRGFAVHEALDQAGALAGPLLVAAVLGASAGDYRPALLTLAAPGALALTLLAWVRIHVPDPGQYEQVSQVSPSKSAPDTGPRSGLNGLPRPPRLPRAFWGYAAFAAFTTTGFVTFGVLSYHLVTSGLLAPPLVPVLYAGAMVVDAIAAVTTGWAYDKYGPVVLVALPVVAATIPVLGFAGTLGLVVTGTLVWGIALGIQESTLRATVADLVPPDRRATAYGIFGAVVGVAAASGGALAGGLYDISISLLVATTAFFQATALVVLLKLLGRPDHSLRTPH